MKRLVLGLNTGEDQYAVFGADVSVQVAEDYCERLNRATGGNVYSVARLDERVIYPHVRVIALPEALAGQRG